MKTIQELYNEVMANEELKAQFIEAAKAGRQEEFLKEHGCDATAAEVSAFLDAKANEDAPLSFDELENAAGGECNETTGREIATSVVTLGIACAVEAAVSAGKGHNGQRNAEEGRICNY